MYFIPTESRRTYRLYRKTKVQPLYLGSFVPSQAPPAPSVLKKLTKAEKLEFEQWYEGWKIDRKLATYHGAIEELPTLITDVINYLKQGYKITSQQQKSILRVLGKLKNLMQDKDYIEMKCNERLAKIGQYYLMKAHENPTI